MNRRQWTIVLLLATAAGFLGGLLAGGAGEEPAGAAIDRTTLRKPYQPSFSEWITVWGNTAWGLVEPGRYDISVRVLDAEVGRKDAQVLIYGRCAPAYRPKLEEQLGVIKKAIRAQIRVWKARGYTSISEDDFRVEIRSLPGSVPGR